MVMETARRFSADLSAAMRVSEKEGVAPNLSAAFDDLGFPLLSVSEENGGMGLGYRLKAAVVRELARGDAAATLALELPHWIRTGLALVGVETSTSDCGGVVDGDAQLAYESGRLSGALQCVVGAVPETLWITTQQQLLSVSGKMSLSPIDLGALHAAGGRALTLDNVPAQSYDLSGDDFGMLTAFWRLLPASIMTGLCRAGYEHARDYCLERESFGKKVAHHQGVAFILSDMIIAAEAAECMVDAAAAGLDANGGCAHSIESLEAAYLQARESALFVSINAVQLLGAAGYVSDHPVEKWMREARALANLFGGEDASMDGAARVLGRQS